MKRSAEVRSRREAAWTRLDDDALLDLRFCDLRLSLASSRLQQSVLRLYGELARKGIRFRPHVWLADEWFSPDGVPGIAIPFYLAHPRLMRLELLEDFAARLSGRPQLPAAGERGAEQGR